MENSEPENVQALLREFEQAIIKESMRLKTLGVSGIARAGSMLSMALAAADYWMQETEGRTLTEDEFAFLARDVHRQIRDANAKGAS